jgi:hypothetical protein
MKPAEVQKAVDAILKLSYGATKVWANWSSYESFTKEI